MPSYIEEPHAAACKWVSIREQQPREVRPADGVLDPDLYPPRDRLSAGHRRRQLSHGDAHRRRGRRLGQMDGAQGFEACSRSSAPGHMAEGALATCNDGFRLGEVRVWSRTQATLDHFVREQQPKYRASRSSRRAISNEIVRGADVVVTVTPARGPIVMAEWIAPGTHIAAVGADKKGDQELEPQHPAAARASSSTTSASAAPTARSTCRCRKGLITRGRHCRRNRRGGHRQEAGPHLRRRDHAVRFDRHRAAGFGHRSARI